MPSWNVCIGAAAATGALAYLLGQRRGAARASLSRPAVDTPPTIVTVPGGEPADVDEGGDDVRVLPACDVVVNDDVMIREVFGGASTGSELASLSVARVTVRRTWCEDWQRPQFDEWTLVLSGVVRIERAGAAGFNARAGEAFFLPRGGLVRWVFPDPTQLPEYVAVCSPAFSPDNCGRGETPASADLPEYESFPALYHAAPKIAWEAAVRAGKPYYPESYEKDGFVHATANPALLIDVLNHFYADKSGEFVCLRIERATLRELGVRVCFEFPAPVGDKPTFHVRKYGATLFPHIYAPLEKRMVAVVMPIVRASPGSGKFIEVDASL